ncbi:MAG TPA: tyrosine--tRNA ligase, partial [Spirochaetota bacterium]|nr:tyrosine--tRNA ligase [Spirochaetota bacterium]
QQMGHTVVFLVGDFTAMIGDPTGKSETRKKLSREQVLANAETYKTQVFRILDPEKTVVRFNSEWCAGMNFADVIELTSKFNVARMLERDDFSKRYKSGRSISIVEFMYPLIQGYDSVALKADVELGGTDQKFNLLVGRDLQKEYGKEGCDLQTIITLPLLVGLDGVNKMSKSLGNYIGITESPRDIFGKVMSISDDLMFTYYELVTDVPRPEIASFKAGIADKSIHPKTVKVNLAKEICAQFYDRDTADKAAAEFEAIFVKKDVPDDMPEYRFQDSDIKDGKVRLANLIVACGCAASTSEARRLIQGGGVTFEGDKIESVDHELSSDAAGVLKVGKRRFVKIVK